MKPRFRAQDLVVYQKEKHGTHPGPRAHDLRPAPAGETYGYFVDKFWIVMEVRPTGQLVVRTPGGKVHEVDPADPNLRRPTWRELLWLRLWRRDRLRALRQAQV